MHLFFFIFGWSAVFQHHFLLLRITAKCIWNAFCCFTVLLPPKLFFSISFYSKLFLVFQHISLFWMLPTVVNVFIYVHGGISLMLTLASLQGFFLLFYRPDYMLYESQCNKKIWEKTWPVVNNVFNSIMVVHGSNLVKTVIRKIIKLLIVCLINCSRLCSAVNHWCD